MRSGTQLRLCLWVYINFAARIVAIKAIRLFIECIIIDGHIDFVSLYKYENIKPSTKIGKKEGIYKCALANNIDERIAAII